MPLQDSKSSTSISFRFKTYQSDSMLFLAAGPIDYCLITLESGQISVCNQWIFCFPLDNKSLL